MERAVVELGERVDVMHQHGIWTMVSRVTKTFRSRFDKPTVVAPHGSLGRWALKRSVWKKRLAELAYESENLNRASCLHAGGESELEEFRDYGIAAPVAIVPNGVSDEWLSSSGDASAFRRKLGIGDDARVLLFLSRITPKKGLPMFLEAMAGMRPRLSNWLFVIAGTDEFGHQREVESTIDRLDLRDRVRFVGPLFDTDKRDAFEASELCVLPSHSEGAPIVVPEALGVGVPVLTTKASPWDDLVTFKCGWWTDIGTESIREALDEALALTQGELRDMGDRGRALVNSRYTWRSIAATYLMLYDWLLGKAETPDFVVIEH
jgi:glycosyltransferase involved in cell wall biosynthesis